MPPKFVPRQRKHKVLARQQAEGAQPVDEAVGKKAKRLEKYLENKRRKDENRELLAKLAERKVDTSLFQSSRALGQGHETKKQARRRAHLKQMAGIGELEANSQSLEQEEVDSDDGDENEDNDHIDEQEAVHQPDDNVSGIENAKNGAPDGQPGAAKAQPQASNLPSLGAGLKRPLEVDDEGRPIMKKRKKRGGVKSKISLVSTVVPTIDPASEESENDEWNGFGSEDDAQGEDEDSQSSAESNSTPGSDSSEESGDAADDDSGEDSESGDEDEDEDEEDGESRPSAFKSWAQQQRNKAAGYTPTTAAAAVLDIPKPDNFKPRAPEQDPLPAELQPTTNTDRKAFSVTIVRTPEIQESRLKLPVVSEEQRLMEAIHNNDIVIIRGATGSGKTTQVPQFLYEAGYGSPNSPTPGMVGVTQPRRVAAVSMAKRVAEELGDHSNVVAHHVRFDTSVNEKTAIKFMTDGLLLREMAEDLALRKYSVIIIDEAHERSVNTDVLIGMLSRVISVRRKLAEEEPQTKPLKLVIMSATLSIDDLTNNPTLFPTSPPVLEVEGRQHPVTTHFSRRTHYDYVEEAFRKITRGHRKLPPGGFLVFLTGQNEILQLSKRLKSAFRGHQTAGPSKSTTQEEILDDEFVYGASEDLVLDDEEDEMVSDEDNESHADDEEFQIEEDQEVAPLKTQILPLYSLLSTKEQLRVFQPPPDNTRQIIIATNVAETSITIPGIRFVFDCGRSKEKRYDHATGVQSYAIDWISKASANQRSGRAGRTGPGHCYRLYSSAVFERDFAEYSTPEILRMPLEGVVLQLKAMNLQHVANIPLPTPPQKQSLSKAEKLLEYLSALSSAGNITEIGDTMSIFPLPPRLARILVMGHIQNCLPYTVALVAGLSVSDIFLPENHAIPSLEDKDDQSIRTSADAIAETRQATVRKMYNQVHRNFCFLDDRSDAIKIFQAVGEFAHEPTEAWCESHFVRYKILKETQQLREQLTSLLRKYIPEFRGLQYQAKLDKPSSDQVSALKQMVAAGFIDQVAIRGDLAPTPPEQWRKPRRAIDVPYVPLIPIHASVVSDDSDKCVYIHPTSPLAHLTPAECPEYIVYAYLQKTVPSSSSSQKPKTRMHALTDVSASQLAWLSKGSPLVTFGKPIKETKPQAGSAATRECWVVPYLRAENSGSQGWPLPPVQVRQKKVPGKGWVVDEWLRKK